MPCIGPSRSATDKIHEVIGSGGKVRDRGRRPAPRSTSRTTAPSRVSSADRRRRSRRRQLDQVHRRRAGSERDLRGHSRQVHGVRRLRELLPGSRDGLVHISQLAPQKVAKVTDVVKDGQKVWVKLLGFVRRSRVRLSMKVVDQATGRRSSAKTARRPRSRPSDRGDPPARDTKGAREGALLRFQCSSRPISYPAHEIPDRSERHGLGSS